MLATSPEHRHHRRQPRPSCYRCFKPRVACICASIEPVANETEIIIVQHPRERFHPIGTTRIARLGLAKVRVESLAQWSTAAPPLAVPSPRTALLYPSADAVDLTQVPTHERPSHLVVIDGTWFHAKKVYDAHEWLRALPSLRLTPSAPSRYTGVRREPRAHCIATVEAIVDALRILEPQTRGLDGLLRTFAAMVERQAAYSVKAVR